MQFLKVSCPQCSKYLECPLKTRMFVNYCGANSKQVEDNIRDAILDCRARKGNFFKRNSAVELSPTAFPHLVVLPTP